MTFKEFYKRLKKIDIERCKENAVKQSDKELVKMNKDQLSQGITAEGTAFSRTYSLSYAKFKKKQSGYKAPFGLPDLKLTGAFYKGMLLVARRGEYFITSKDKKTFALQDYAEPQPIFGIDPNRKKEAQSYVTPRFNKIIKKSLNV